MKTKKVTIKILRVLKKSYSYYGNPKYYIVGLVNGDNYEFKTGDNISSAYCGMYEGQTIEAQIHKTSKGNYIIDYYRYIKEGE